MTHYSSAYHPVPDVLATRREHVANAPRRLPGTGPATSAAEISYTPAGTRAAGEFDFSRGEIEIWHAEAKRTASREVRTPFLRSRVGYLTLNVQGRFDPISDEPDNTFVQYTLTWTEPFDPDACKEPGKTTTQYQGVPGPYARFGEVSAGRPELVLPRGVRDNDCL